MQITRGDTKALYFQRKRNDEPILEEIDKVYFTVKTNDDEDNKEIIFQKTKEDMTFDEDGIYHFVINPEDTETLNYGDYVYDLEVKASNYTKTIDKGVFSITSEVTHKENEG